MTRKRVAWLMCVFAVALQACASAEVALGPCRRQSFETSGFIVCAFDGNTDELRIATASADGTNLRGFAALEQSLGADAKRVRFAMNAGMFDDEGRAIGLEIENGEIHHAINTADGPGNFHMKPNGVFSQDAQGTLHIETSERYIEAARDTAWATQSGPMLVIGGKLHPKIQHDGTSRYVRNGVGLIDSNHALFVISRGPVSFGKIARFFRDALGCKDALYFDGSVSSLWAPSLARMDSARLLGPMVVVLDRSAIH